MKQSFLPIAVLLTIAALAAGMVYVAVRTDAMLRETNPTAFLHANTSTSVVPFEEGIVERNVVPDPMASWTTATIDAAGVTFRYPAALGAVTMTPIVAETGNGFRGSFSGDPALTLGGISDDFSAGRGGSVLDSRGYTTIDNVPYFLFVASKASTDYPLEPVETIATPIGDVLLIDGESFTTERGSDGPTFSREIGSGLAALVNLPKETGYRGMTILAKNLSVTDRATFVLILRSLAFAG